MKLAINFVAPPWRWRVVAGIAAAIASIMVIAAIALASGMQEIVDQQTLLGRRLDRVSRQLADQPRVQLPASADREALRSRVAMLNAQGAAKGWSTAQLLVWLEEQMPVDVRLVSIHHKSREGEALLVAESANATSLTAFLQRLEHEPAFAEVLLAKQGGRTAETDAVRFEIRLKLRA
jgi:hypothetical protein